MENCKLPRDLLIDILARLSVKSLMRFKFVCKFFYNLIKNDHQFIQKHFEFGRDKNLCAILEFQSPDYPIPTLISYLLYKELETSETRCIYLDIPNSKIRCVKCCDGLLCVIVGKGYPSEGYYMHEVTLPGMIFDFFALNPFTREIKILPSIKVPNHPSNKPPTEFELNIGFGFGISNSMVWKIIMLVIFSNASSQGKTEDSYEIVMVCSQVGDLWDWRQIDAVPLSPTYLPYLIDARDLYLKGKYYWQCLNNLLIWFDMDDEVFGKIEIPIAFNIDFVTVINETIALISAPHVFVRDEYYIDIWLMDENNNIINWQKQASIHSGYNINEYWTPIGIWNMGAELLVFSGYLERRYDEVADCNVRFFKDGIGPNLISIDLVTQEKKIICSNQEKKSALNIDLNLAGHVQVCNERTVTKAQEWNETNIGWHCPGLSPYARVFSESLKFL